MGAGGDGKKIGTLVHYYWKCKWCSHYAKLHSDFQKLKINYMVSIFFSLIKEIKFSGISDNYLWIETHTGTVLTNVESIYKETQYF